MLKAPFGSAEKGLFECQTASLALSNGIFSTPKWGLWHSQIGPTEKNLMLFCIERVSLKKINTSFDKKL